VLPVVAPLPGKPVVAWLTDRPVVALPLVGGYRSSLACWPQRWLVRAESWGSSKGFGAAAWEIPAHLNGCIAGSLRVRYAADAHGPGSVPSSPCSEGEEELRTAIYPNDLSPCTRDRYPHRGRPPSEGGVLQRDKALAVRTREPS
jgi:hypothetical protein